MPASTPPPRLYTRSMSNFSPGDRDPWLGGGAPAPRRREGGSERGRRGGGTGQPYGGDRDARRERPQRDSGYRQRQPEWSHERSRREQQPAGQTLWRLFIGVELPSAAIEEIATFINEMPVKTEGLVRWTPRANVHLTLQFLGDTDPAKLPEIQERIAAAASNTSPILLALGETGAFPQFRAPRILWVGLTGEVRRLVQLQGRIEGSMTALGYEPERRPFTPHISVGRTGRSLTDQQAGDIGFGWRRTKLPPERTKVTVSEVVLFRSKLQDGGPVYEKLFTAKLGG